MNNSSRNFSNAPPNDQTTVVVGGLKGEGEKRYVITYTLEDSVFGPEKIAKGTNITFTLCYWKFECEPRKGECITLSDIRRFAKGWRAFCAKPIMLDTSQKNGGTENGKIF